ncbi:MAG: hypothetical protein ABSD88_03025 [Candidatus Korobacteraceae bacterium]
MNALHKLDDWFVGRVSFPATNYLLNRSGVLASYRELLKSEYYPQEQLEEMQLRRFRAVLRHAYQLCPYYTKKLKQLGVAPDEIRSLEDVRRIPALSKREVVEHGEEMIDMRYRRSLQAGQGSPRVPGQPGQPIPLGRFRRRKLIRNVSSGSTGAPVAFYDDGSISAASWAFELRLRRWYGIEAGAREARMARVSADYMPNDRQIWARKRLWHQLMLPGSNLTDKEYALCLRKLREFKPRVLWGYTAALAGLAEYAQRSGEDVSSFSPELAIGWAGPVYEHEEKIIKDVFGCAVSNIYSSREVGHIAAWCPNHTWHVSQEHVLVESNADPAQGELGEIIVTPLSLSPMPFIRYRLGDIGQLASSKCACGRTLQVMQDFLGRTGEIFVTKDGRMITAVFWNRIFMVGGQSQFVERFQIVYRRPDQIAIRIVKRNGFAESIEEDIRQILRKNFSPDIHFQFEYVPRIDPQASGKYQVVVNEVGRRH